MATSSTSSTSSTSNTSNSTNVNTLSPHNAGPESISSDAGTNSPVPRNTPAVRSESTKTQSFAWDSVDFPKSSSSQTGSVTSTTPRVMPVAADGPTKSVLVRANARKIDCTEIDYQRALTSSSTSAPSPISVIVPASSTASTAPTRLKFSWQEPFLEAIASKNDELVKAYLDLADCRVEDLISSDKFHSILKKAIEEKDDNLAARLVKKYAVFSTDQQYRKNFFLRAVIHDMKLTAAAFLNNGFHRDYQSENGNTALHFSIEAGSENVFKLLIKYKASINIRNYEGNTPLIHSCDFGQYGMFFYMLDSIGETKMDATKEIGNLKKWSAAVSGDTFDKTANQNKLFEKLTAAYIATFIKSIKEGDAEICNFFLKRSPCLATSIDEETGKTALRIALESGNEDVVCALLNKKVEIHAVSGAGKTPLMLALEAGFTRAACEIINRDVYEDVSFKNSGHKTALHVAVQYGNLEVVELLLDKKSDPARKDGLKKSPLLYACQSDDPNIFSALFEQQKLIQKKFSEKELGKMLLIAADGKNDDSVTEILNILIKNGAPVNAASKITGDRLLHIVARNGHFKAASILINAPGIELMATNSKRQTALFFVKPNYTQMSNLLTDVGITKGYQS